MASSGEATAVLSSNNPFPRTPSPEEVAHEANNTTPQLKRKSDEYQSKVKGENENDSDSSTDIEVEAKGIDESDSEISDFENEANTSRYNTHRSDRSSPSILSGSHWLHNEEEVHHLLDDEAEDDAEASLHQISDEQVKYYSKYFIELQPDLSGGVTGKIARDFFLKSGLPQGELAGIWELVDIGHKGALLWHEFVAAMHLIVLRKHSFPVPTPLPDSLHPLSINARRSLLYQTYQSDSTKEDWSKLQPPNEEPPPPPPGQSNRQSHRPLHIQYSTPVSHERSKSPTFSSDFVPPPEQKDALGRPVPPTPPPRNNVAAGHSRSASLDLKQIPASSQGVNSPQAVTNAPALPPRIPEMASAAKGGSLNVSASKKILAEISRTNADEKTARRSSRDERRAKTMVVEVDRNDENSKKIVEEERPKSTTPLSDSSPTKFPPAENFLMSLKKPTRPSLNELNSMSTNDLQELILRYVRYTDALKKINADLNEQVLQSRLTKFEAQNEGRPQPLSN